MELLLPVFVTLLYIYNADVFDENRLCTCKTGSRSDTIFIHVFLKKFGILKGSDS